MMIVHFLQLKFSILCTVKQLSETLYLASAFKSRFPLLHKHGISLTRSFQKGILSL